MCVFETGLNYVVHVKFELEVLCHGFPSVELIVHNTQLSFLLLVGFRILDLWWFSTTCLGTFTETDQLQFLDEDADSNIRMKYGGLDLRLGFLKFSDPRVTSLRDSVPHCPSLSIPGPWDIWKNRFEGLA